MLRDILPQLSRLAIVYNPLDPGGATHFSNAKDAAGVVAATVRAVEVRSSSEFDAAFGMILRDRPDAVLVVADALTFLERKRIVDFATKHALPTAYEFKEFANWEALSHTGLARAPCGSAEHTMLIGSSRVRSLPTCRSSNRPSSSWSSTSRPPRRSASPFRQAARPRRRGDRMSAPAASWCDPAGGSPAQVRSSVRLVASVAWPLATVVAKRTQRLHGVWD